MTYFFMESKTPWKNYFIFLNINAVVFPNLGFLEIK